MLGKSSPLSFPLMPCYTLCRLNCVCSIHVLCLVQFVCSGKHKLEICFFFFLKEATQFYMFYCFIYIQNKWKFLKKDMHVYKRSLCTYFTFN